MKQHLRFLFTLLLAIVYGGGIVWTDDEVGNLHTWKKC